MTQSLSPSKKQNYWLSNWGQRHKAGADYWFVQSRAATRRMLHHPKQSEDDLMGSVQQWGKAVTSIEIEKGQKMPVIVTFMVSFVYEDASTSENAFNPGPKETHTYLLLRSDLLLFQV